MHIEQSILRHIVVKLLEFKAKESSQKKMTKSGLRGTIMKFHVNIQL